MEICIKAIATLLLSLLLLQQGKCKIFFTTFGKLHGFKIKIIAIFPKKDSTKEIRKFEKSIF